MLSVDSDLRNPPNQRFDFEQNYKQIFIFRCSVIGIRFLSKILLDFLINVFFEISKSDIADTMKNYTLSQKTSWSYR